MLRVGICDDELLITEVLQEKILRIAYKYKWDISVSCFNAGRTLLETIDNLEVVFLDIDMPELDGIETGKKICEMNDDCKIIMATGRVDKFKEAFRIQAFRFVTKPFEDTELEEALQAVMDTQIGMETIELYEKRNPYYIPQKDILYISAYNGYSEFVVSGRETERILRKDNSLSEIEKELSKDLFFRVSRQYIINLGKVLQFHNGMIHIHDKRISVSRRRKKAFEQVYIEYDLKYRK